METISGQVKIVTTDEFAITREEKMFHPETGSIIITTEEGQKIISLPSLLREIGFDGSKSQQLRVVKIPECGVALLILSSGESVNQ